MKKEQVLIIRVKYEDKEDKSPHTWDWAGIAGPGREVEVLNHGVSEDAT